MKREALACLVFTMATSLLGAPVAAQENEKALDKIFNVYASKTSPGCAVGATRGGTKIFAKAYGMADLEHDVPLAPQSVFYMASVSKQFMAFSILLLEQDGKLNVEDRVRKYVPELPQYADAITIRQLLHHTSGLRDYLDLTTFSSKLNTGITEKDVLNLLARQARLNFVPGAEYTYSNSGYVLLSIIAQRVSGRLLDEFARERIFMPLGMSSTRFQHDHTTPIIGRAIGYVQKADAWKISNSMLDVVGDGGMYSSVEDMLRWAAAFEKPEFAPHLARMQKIGMLSDGREIAAGYGMGLVTFMYRGQPIVGHGGSLAGYRNRLFRLPANNLTIITLCNAGMANAVGFSQQVAELVAPADLWTAPAVATSAPPTQTAPTSPIPRDFAKAVAGVFYSAELDTIYRIVDGADGVMLEADGKTPLALSMTGPDRLGAANVKLELVPTRDDAAKVNGFMFSALGERGIKFTRR